MIHVVSNSEPLAVLDTSKLRMNLVELRKYQVSIAYNSTLASTMVVLPTGLGKTLIANYTMSHILCTKGPKILFLAPTRPLVVQHFNDFKEIFKDEVKILMLTGAVRGKRRSKVINSDYDVLISTPQIIQRMIEDDDMDMKDFSLVVFDEAHHGTGKYAYTYIAGRYLIDAGDKALTMGITASPDYELEDIVEICDNLGFQNVEIRGEWDIDVRPYVHKRTIKRIDVVPFPELNSIHKHLLVIMKDLVDRLHAMGLAVTRVSKLTKTEILNINKKIDDMLNNGMGRSEAWLYEAKAVVSAMLTLSVALEYARNQGLPPLYKYLQDIINKKDEKRSYRIIATHPALDTALSDIERLMSTGMASHPKIIELQRLLRNEYHRLGEDMRIIIFTNYRETCDMVYNAIKHQENIKPVRFFGQASKGGKRGMTQRMQREAIEAFESGEYNVMVATQVGEEGIDIPETDIVIFYEPVPSGIRAIQRRGRTARKKEGRVYIFVTKGAEDEKFYWSAIKKERNMKVAIDRIKKELKKANIHYGVPKNISVELQDGKLYIYPPNRPTLSTILGGGTMSSPKIGGNSTNGFDTSKTTKKQPTLFDFDMVDQKKT